VVYGKMNILISTSSFAEYDKSILDDIPEEFNVILNPYKKTLNESEIGELLVQYEVNGLIAGVETLTMEVLTAANTLKVISRCGAGLDNVDLKAAAKLGIKVFNTPDAPTNAVAELTLGLILNCLRKISFSDRGIRKGTWRKTMGNLLQGRVVGIIGFGRIGKTVGNLVRAFGAEVIYNDLVKDSEFDWARCVKLDELLRSADIISLHLPLVDTSDYFINAEKISLMKEGAILINTSRGRLVDEDALYDALESGKLASAGFDVFEKEPYSGKLAEVDNAVLTCHIGSYATESRILMERQAVENLLKGLSK
jgi:D-3-phosphoglycerate dehydrogenase